MIERPRVVDAFSLVGTELSGQFNSLPLMSIVDVSVIRSLSAVGMCFTIKSEMRMLMNMKDARKEKPPRIPILDVINSLNPNKTPIPELPNRFGVLPQRDFLASVHGGLGHFTLTKLLTLLDLLEDARRTDIRGSPRSIRVRDSSQCGGCWLQPRIPPRRSRVWRLSLSVLWPKAYDGLQHASTPSRVVM